MADDTKDSAALQEELDRVRKEKEELSAKLAETPEEKARHRTARIRWIVAIVMIVLGSVVAAFAVTAVWLDRLVLDTNTWVETVAPLASEPVVQSYVADTATNALFQAVDVQKLATEGLPPRLKPFAPAIANAVRGFVHDQALAFTRSPQFATAWAEANRIGHKAVVAAITPGQAGALASQNGKVTLDIGILVDQVKQRLVNAGLGIVANVPTSSLQGRQIVLFESPALAQAQAFIQALIALAIVLPILALVLLIGAIPVAVERRKAVLWVGVGLVVAMLLPIEGLYLARYPIVAQVSAALPAAVAGVIYDTVTRGLVQMQQAVLIVGLVVWVAAVVAGPARWAVALREGASKGVSHIGAELDFGAFGEFVHGNKPLLRGIGFGLGVVALVFVPGSKLAVLAWIVVIEIVWLLLIEFFGRSRPGATRGGGDAAHGRRPPATAA